MRFKQLAKIGNGTLKDSLPGAFSTPPPKSTVCCLIGEKTSVVAFQGPGHGSQKVIFRHHRRGAMQEAASDHCCLITLSGTDADVECGKHATHTLDTILPTVMGMIF